MRRVGYACALFVFLTATMAPVVAAAPQGEALPPPPEWPIIGPILRWLGLVEGGGAVTPTPTPSTPSPSPAEVLTFEPETVEELIEFWKSAVVGETLRFVLKESTVQAMADRWLDPLPGLSRPTIAFADGIITLSGEVETAKLKEYLGFEPPDFLIKGPIEIVITLSAGAEACRPQIAIETVELNGRRWPLAHTLQSMLDERLMPLWNEVPLCVERIEITDEALIVEGHRLP